MVTLIGQRMYVRCEEPSKQLDTSSVTLRMWVT
jgi:hypothetical protein